MVVATALRVAPTESSVVGQWQALGDVVLALAEGFDATCLTAAHARELVAVVAQVARVVGGVQALAAARVVETGGWKDTAARSPQEWLAALSGSSVAAAGEALDVGRSLAELPTTHVAVRAGAVSVSQAAQVVRAARADSSSEPSLLDAAAGGATVRELRELAQAVINAADADPDATYQRQRDRRSWSTRTDDDGTWVGTLRTTADRAAPIEAAVRSLADWLGGQATSTGAEPARLSHRLADAAAMLLSQPFYEPPAPAPTGGPPPGDGPRPTVGSRPTPGPPLVAIRGLMGLRGQLDVVRADLLAIARGRLAKGEVCAVDGTGSVPLPAARALLADAAVKLVVTKGASARRVLHLGGAPPDELQLPPPRRQPGAPPTYLGLIRVDLADLACRSADPARPSGDPACPHVQLPDLGVVCRRRLEQLLGARTARALVERGVAVRRLVHTGRTLTAHQRAALLWEQPTCAVAGCSETRDLEIDHSPEWARTGVSLLLGADRLCGGVEGGHHRKRTLDGWALVPGRGERELVPPDDPRHPGSALPAWWPTDPAQLWDPPEEL